MVVVVAIKSAASRAAHGQIERPAALAQEAGENVVILRRQNLERCERQACLILVHPFKAVTLDRRSEAGIKPVIPLMGIHSPEHEVFGCYLALETGVALDEVGQQALALYRVHVRRQVVGFLLRHKGGAGL